MYTTIPLWLLLSLNIALTALASYNTHNQSSSPAAAHTTRVEDRLDNENNITPDDHTTNVQVHEQYAPLGFRVELASAANQNKSDNNWSNASSESSPNRLNLEQREEHESLRLEYYKYKILSQLGITKDPELLQPSINGYLRDQLTSDLTATRDQYSTDKLARHKRSLACNQVKSSKDTCCVETFYVNFTDIGWDKWILHPSGYNANYCRGQCDLSHSRYYHSTLLSKFNSIIGLCCSPKKMLPLQILYIDEKNQVHQRVMPDMIVESCDCA